MVKLLYRFRHLFQLASMLLTLIVDAVCYLGLCLRPSPTLIAENLFLHKQLALYQERQIKPRRATNIIRIALVWLGRWFDWRPALAVVQPKTFRTLYVFVAIEHVSRRLIHVNVTVHPTEGWTLQQLREAIPAIYSYRVLIHDRDSIFSKHVDQGVRHMGLCVLKTPVQTPVANAICERVIGTLRRECLDFLIPLGKVISTAS